jgi:hypothetical protein
VAAAHSCVAWRRLHFVLLCAQCRQWGHALQPFWGPALQLSGTAAIASPVLECWVLPRLARPWAGCHEQRWDAHAQRACTPCHTIALFVPGAQARPACLQEAHVMSWHCSLLAVPREAAVGCMHAPGLH